MYLKLQLFWSPWEKKKETAHEIYNHMKTINFITCFWQFLCCFMMLNSNCTRIWAWIPVPFKKPCVSFPFWGENSLQVWYIGIYMYASTERKLTKKNITKIIFTQRFAWLFNMFLFKTGPNSPYQLIRQICVISWFYCYLFLFFISFYHL